ncbi:MAG: Hsp20/alpha crystallin family protein [Bacteroidales bacterium]|nr:Hsp20/alpha crystallin family protein [Bacteroidales bacterium]
MLVRYENKPSIPNLWEDFFGPNLMGDVYHKSRVSNLPSANIIEEKDKYFIELAAPGLEKADFNIKLSENVLTVSVEKEENIENATQREFSYTSFSRGFNIPETIQNEKIKAEYENGILQIALPKKEEAIIKPPREIKIS